MVEATRIKKGLSSDRSITCMAHTSFACCAQGADFEATGMQDEQGDDDAASPSEAEAAEQEEDEEEMVDLGAGAVPSQIPKRSAVVEIHIIMTSLAAVACHVKTTSFHICPHEVNSTARVQHHPHLAHLHGDRPPCFCSL